jgi:hypothetical protein
MKQQSKRKPLEPVATNGHAKLALSREEVEMLNRLPLEQQFGVMLVLRALQIMELILEARLKAFDENPT